MWPLHGSLQPQDRNAAAQDLSLGPATPLSESRPLVYLMNFQVGHATRERIPLMVSLHGKGNASAWPGEIGLRELL